MRSVLFLLMLSITLMIAAAATADSLWPAACSGSAYADRKAHRVGDVLTVLIVESSVSSHSAKTETAKDLSVSGDAGTGFLDIFRAFSLGGKRSSSGSGGATQSTKLVDRMSVTVVEVTPNGLLRVQGEREVCLNAERLKLTLSGVVRREDVGPDNTVISSQVADLRISSNGKGPIPDTQKPGLIYRLIRLLF